MTRLTTSEDKISALEEQILRAFKQSLSEERSEVAEHLLRALETLQPKPTPGTSIAKAYLAISDRTINGVTVPRRLR